MTKQFIPMTNLDALNEEQKQQYYIDVCQHFDIPYNLNLLGYFRMDSGDGGTHLVLYAKKGATDIIRDRLQINTISLTSEQIGEALVYTATGRNDKNRTEIAVGAADIKGKVGKALTDAIMTAQTRATRRMTLQFVGGGLLDESEVQQGMTVNINSVSTPISQIAAAPVPVPNATPPKDITLFVPCNVPTAEQLEAQKILAKMDPTKLAIAAQENVPQTGTIVPELSTEPVAKKRRKRQEVNLEFDLGAPDIQPAKTSAPEPVVEPVTPVSAPVTSEPTLAKQPDIQPDIPTAKPAPLPGVPTSEQLKEYRQRLTKYTDDILPKNSMVPSVGLGGPTVKTRLYAMQRFKVTDIRHMTVDNWTEFFSFLDNTEPAELVRHIDEAVTGK